MNDRAFIEHVSQELREDISKLKRAIRTPGRVAYEADCNERPNYHDGSLRAEWDEISEVARWSWERYAEEME